MKIYVFNWSCNCFTSSRGSNAWDIYFTNMAQTILLLYLSNILFDVDGLELDGIACYLAQTGGLKSILTGPQQHLHTQNNSTPPRQGVPIDEPQTLKYSCCSAGEEIATTIATVIATVKARGVITTDSLFDALAHGNNKVEDGVAAKQFSYPVAAPGGIVSLFFLFVFLFASFFVCKFFCLQVFLLFLFFFTLVATTTKDVGNGIGGDGLEFLECGGDVF